MSVGNYLYFQGNCREAVTFYADVFKTEPARFMTYGDIPGGGGEMPEAMKKLVLHADLEIGGGLVMFSDATPDRPVTFGNNISVIVGLKNEDAVKAVYMKLKEGGEVIMALQETFFSKCYAYLKDRFGVNWQLTLENE
ncbi:VOC family protein [Oscillospiraceae bacterium WX1]